MQMGDKSITKDGILRTFWETKGETVRMMVNFKVHARTFRNVHIRKRTNGPLFYGKKYKLVNYYVDIANENIFRLL